MRALSHPQTSSHGWYIYHFDLLHTNGDAPQYTSAKIAVTMSQITLSYVIRDIVTRTNPVALLGVKPSDPVSPPGCHPSNHALLLAQIPVEQAGYLCFF